MIIYIQVGEENFRICNDIVDGIITVNTNEICLAIKETFNDIRTILEPAGVLAAAGMLKYSRELKAQAAAQKQSIDSNNENNSDNTKSVVPILHRKKTLVKSEGRNFVAITSGANINFDKLTFIAERARINQRTICVQVPETPGSFKRLMNALEDANITGIYVHFHTHAYTQDVKSSFLISIILISIISHLIDMLFATNHCPHVRVYTYIQNDLNT